MAEPLLVFENITLHSEEGKALFVDFHWTVQRSAKINVRTTSSRTATALFRLAAGVLHPQEGQVVLDGSPLGPHAFDHPYLHRGALGWVPRDGGLLANLDLLGNLCLPLIFTKRMERSQAETKVLKALDHAGLSEVANHRPHALDPSERWLGSLIRAWLMEPELWLVDQPSSSLHHHHQESAATLLGEAVSSHATLVIAGDYGWVPWNSMQVVRLEHGKLTPGDRDAVRT
jgi:ABC-type ATPase involved in cell division